MNSLKLILSAIMLTSANYSIAYLLSSHEVLFDYKNFSFIFIFSILWLYLRQQFKNKTAFWEIYILSCTLGFTVPILAYFSEPIFLQRLMKDFLFWYTFPLIFLSANTWQLNNKLISNKLPYIATSINIIALIPLAIIILYYATFNTQISIDSILAMLQTNKDEAIEFIKTYITAPKILIATLVIAIVTISIFKLYHNLFLYKSCTPPLRNRKFFIFLNVILLISCFMFAEKTYIARSITDAISRNKLMNNFSMYSHDRLQKLANNLPLATNSETSNFALIIGETHSRSNMSAYGYERQTTPWLENVVKNKEIILLKNAFSNSAVTTASLEYALSAHNQYNNLTFENALTITEIAQANGFNVIWISNQVDDNIAGMIGHQANKQFWLNQKHNDTWLRQKNNLFDSNIIDCLERLPKQNQKTLFVIHILGSHASYDCRYPEQYNKWNDKDNLLNAYDNSVLYNDYIMSKIYQLLFNKFEVDGMLYFSDHGEDLKLKFCHGNEYFLDNYKKHASVKEIVKIPVYFAFSSKYKQNNSEVIHSLINNSLKYFTNDMVYDTMLGIMHIKEPYYNPKYDITSSNYDMNLDNLKTIHGKVNLKDCL